MRGYLRRFGTALFLLAAISPASAEAHVLVLSESGVESRGLEPALTRAPGAAPAANSSFASLAGSRADGVRVALSLPEPQRVPESTIAWLALGGLLLVGWNALRS